MIKKYIRGVEGRGPEILQTLLDLGGDYTLVAHHSDYLYFINKDNKIECVKEDSFTGSLIIDAWEEIKLPELFEPQEIIFYTEKLVTGCVGCHFLNKGINCNTVNEILGINCTDKQIIFKKK